MLFWDSSALVQLMVEQDFSEELKSLIQEDPGLWVWWGSEVECFSAIARLNREGHISDRELEESVSILEQYKSCWHEVLPTNSLRMKARRLLSIHPLRAADSLQLAAAIQASDNESHACKFITFDERLRTAARKEGFVTLISRGI